MKRSNEKSSAKKSKGGTADDKGNHAKEAPKKKRLVVVVRRPKKRHRPLKILAKPGLPNLTKELTEAPPEDNTNNDDEDNDEDAILFPVMDEIPCDTLLAFQSLTSPDTPHLCLPIPLQASTEPIATILESQLYGVVQQDDQDHESLAMITRELQDLFHKNILRRLSSISTTGGGGAGGGTNLTVLILTQDYIRGVWDALDAADNVSTTTTTTTSAENDSNNPQQRAAVHRTYVEWFVEHLHRWTGQSIRQSQLEDTWARHPPSKDVAYQYNVVLNLSHAVEYWQRLEILMPANTHGSVGGESTYQLWLPTWGETLATVQTAQTKFVQKVRLTSHKEVSEFSFVQQQPYYKHVSTKFLLQWMLDCGMVHKIPKPFGNFIRLVQKQPKQQASGGGGNKKRRKHA